MRATKPAWIAFWMIVGATPLSAQVALLQSDPRWTVGVIDGALAFGEITDVTVMEDNRIVVLDRGESTLWLLDAAGELISKTGRSGRGPGEFVGPAALDASGARLYVLDQGAGRVSVYEVADQQLRFLDNWVLPGLFYDLCAIGEQIFLLGAFQGHALHELSPSGSVTRSFDPVPSASAGDFVALEEQGFFSSGRLVCDGAARRVMVAPTMRRTVRAYDLNRRAAWTATLPDFHEAQVVPRGSAYGMAPDPSSGRVTQTESAVAGGKDLWVQVRELSTQGGGTEGGLRSWAVNMQDGVVRPLPSLPPLRAVEAGWVLATPDGLVPRLQAWRSEPNW